MIVLPHELRFALRANAVTAAARAEQGLRFDPVPVLKLFNPVGAATWIATELDEDGDTLFGLADLGFGCPELGSFRLAEIASIRLPYGLAIERDLHFAPVLPLSRWAVWARRTGSIIAAERELARLARDRIRPLQLPLPDPGDG